MDVCIIHFFFFSFLVAAMHIYLSNLICLNNKYIYFSFVPFFWVKKMFFNFLLAFILYFVVVAVGLVFFLSLSICVFFLRRSYFFFGHTLCTQSFKKQFRHDFWVFVCVMSISEWSWWLAAHQFFIFFFLKNKQHRPIIIYMIKSNKKKET